jgi:hypothetical protein
LSYPLAPDLDGLHHLFTSFLTIEIRNASWHERGRWLEVVGADVLVTPEPAETPSVVLHTIQRSFGTRSLFYRVLEPAPTAWWPDAIERASSPLDAFRRVARSPAGSLPGVVPEPVEHRPGGRVRVLTMDPDRIELEVESEGGLVVVQRAFQPLFRARAGEQDLPTIPVNLALLGVVVPPGKHTVEVTVSSAPETIAAVVAVMIALAATAVLVRGSRRRRPIPS